MIRVRHKKCDNRTAGYGAWEEDKLQSASKISLALVSTIVQPALAPITNPLLETDSRASIHLQFHISPCQLVLAYDLLFCVAFFELSSLVHGKPNNRLNADHAPLKEEGKVWHISVLLAQGIHASRGGSLHSPRDFPAQNHGGGIKSSQALSPYCVEMRVCMLSKRSSR